VADSPSVASFLTDKLGMADDRVMTWPLFEQLILEPPPARWDGQEVLRIGSIGRLHPVKNYDLLIEAIAHLRRLRPDIANRIHLTIVGDGPERVRLETLVASWGLQSMVDLPGAASDVRPWLRSWHLYAQPSRYEGMCLAAHEAMSAGLPVLVTPVGELQESVRASGGGLVLDGDVVPSLTAAIEELLGSPESLVTMGEAGKSYVERTYSTAAFERAGMAVVRRVEELAGVPG
jgi:glycosyltransferase involved in cell wall biosynthesis